MITSNVLRKFLNLRSRPWKFIWAMINLLDYLQLKHWTITGLNLNAIKIQNPTDIIHNVIVEKLRNKKKYSKKICVTFTCLFFFFLEFFLLSEENESKFFLEC